MLYIGKISLEKKYDINHILLVNTVASQFVCVCVFRHNSCQIHPKHRRKSRWKKKNKYAEHNWNINFLINDSKIQHLLISGLAKGSNSLIKEGKTYLFYSFVNRKWDKLNLEQYQKKFARIYLISAFLTMFQCPLHKLDECSFPFFFHSPFILRSL